MRVMQPCYMLPIDQTKAVENWVLGSASAPQTLPGFMFAGMTAK